MTPVQRLAHYIGRQSWLPKAGPLLTFVDSALQRWTGGRLAVSRLAGMTSVLLITTGRRTGQPRRTPLIAIPEGGTLLLVGSNFGKPGHPAWSSNLIAHPDAEVLTLGHTFSIRATLLSGEERARAWLTLMKVWPAYSDYAARSGREIRVFRITLR